ncbi:MAG: acyl carrier protein [Synergistaceae bacterium]|jgi:acyl carrier protein|nr:acyl carrier protein [Synergistaceae bacterium]
MEHFIEILRDAINMDGAAELEDSSALAGLDGWDSLGKFMFLSAAFTDYGVTIEPSDLSAVVTVADLWALIGASRQNA